MNKHIILGNLGKDPEVKYLENGTCLAKFPVATSETYKNAQGEKVVDTQWHNVSMWGKIAEVCEKYLKKGDKVLIEGKSVTRSWETAEGEKRYTTELVGREMTMLTPKNQNNQTSQTPPLEGAPEGSDENDDLPF